MHPEAEHRDEGDADLRELEALGDQGLVEPVGDLAADRGQEEIGRDEDRGRQRDERLGRLL